jgi:hypothetical protein
MQTPVGIVGLGNAGSAPATAQELGIPPYTVLASHAPYGIAAGLGTANLDDACLAALWEQWAGVRFSEAEPHVDRR